jgi:hypothetical protein
MDALVGTALIFFLIILVSYAILFYVQYRRYLPGTEKLLVLNTRTAMFLPFYAFFILICVASPESLPAVNVPITLMEGYSFYCFFTMIVINLHGPNNALAVFRASGKELACCNSCCPTDDVKFYQKTVWALFHVVVTRTVVVIIAAIAFYSNTKAGNAVYVICNALGTVILFYSLTHLVLFCKFFLFLRLK